jgi:hypothetical protein
MNIYENKYSLIFDMYIYKIKCSFEVFFTRWV